MNGPKVHLMSVQVEEQMNQMGAHMQSWMRSILLGQGNRKMNGPKVHSMSMQVEEHMN